MVTIGDPWADPPITGIWWRQASSAERIAAVIECLHLESSRIKVLSTTQHGLVVFGGDTDMKPSERGNFWMGIEIHLKERLDPAIRVELQHQADRNALRRLRGIEVKGP